jgi:hypothetical protein
MEGAVKPPKPMKPVKPVRQWAISDQRGRLALGARGEVLLYTHANYAKSQTNAGERIVRVIIMEAPRGR